MELNERGLRSCEVWAESKGGVSCGVENGEGEVGAGVWKWDPMAVGVQLLRVIQFLGRCRDGFHGGGGGVFFSYFYKPFHNYFQILDFSAGGIIKSY